LRFGWTGVAAFYCPTEVGTNFHIKQRRIAGLPSRNALILRAGKPGIPMNAAWSAPEFLKSGAAFFLGGMLSHHVKRGEKAE
jgi:hypothetical protein